MCTPPPVDRMTPVKHYLRKLRLRTVKIFYKQQTVNKPAILFPIHFASNYFQSRFVFHYGFTTPLFPTLWTYSLLCCEIFYYFVQMTLEEMASSSFPVTHQQCPAASAEHFNNMIGRYHHNLKGKNDLNL